MSVIYLPCVNWKVEPDRVLVVGRAESLLEQIQPSGSGSGPGGDATTWLMTQLAMAPQTSGSTLTRRIGGRLNLHKRRTSQPRQNFKSWMAGDFGAAGIFSAPVAPVAGKPPGAGVPAAPSLQLSRKRPANGGPSHPLAKQSKATRGGDGDGGAEGGPPRPVIDAPTLLDMARTLSPTADEPDAAASHFRYSGGKPLRLTLAALPTSRPSRHGCPAWSHAITDVVKRASKGGGHLVVLLVLEDEAHAFAAGCAVARAFPLYSRKGGRAEGIPARAPSAPACGAAAAAVPAPAAASVVMWSGPDAASTESAEDEIDSLLHASAAIQLAGRLVDAPPNELHVDAFVEEARAVARNLNFGFAAEGNGNGHAGVEDGSRVTVRVIRGEELREKGMGGLYGVGKAAVHPPALVVLSYDPPAHHQQGTAAAPRTGGVALVGKGITYDTGGLSLKGRERMPGMKRDMGGAAAVLGAFEAAVHCADTFLLDGRHRPLHAVLCLAENAIGPAAIRNDDVLTMYSGKSVEVNNTDAEGRLVLGDGVAFAARDLGADTVVDVATLTGAQGVATGRRVGAIYASDADLEAEGVAAGRRSGDLVHPVPYVPELVRGEFRSAVADLKNSVRDRSNAQVSCAAQFIGEHLPDGFLTSKEGNKRWMHVDMASPNFYKSDERASGFGVALLLELLRGGGGKKCAKAY